jgi:nucleoside phosphorylase
MTQKYRKGDIVTVKAVVQRDFTLDEGEQVYLTPRGHYTSIFVDPDAVAIVQPYFAAGERVQTKTSKPRNPVRGTVIAMNDDAVWVKFDHGKHGTVPAVELEPSTETKLGVAA